MNARLEELLEQVASVGYMVGASAAGVALILVLGGAAILAVVGIPWAMIHGVLELGQLAGLYDWEPTLWHSLFGLGVGTLIKMVFAR